jgi:hypothetical protein
MVDMRIDVVLLIAKPRNLWGVDVGASESSSRIYGYGDMCVAA